MSRRRRKSSKSKPWLWIIGAVVGGIALYYAIYRPGHRGSIPIPGEEAASPEPAEHEKRAGSGVSPPREELRKSDHEALDRVLRDHAH